MVFLKHPFTEFLSLDCSWSWLTLFMWYSEKVNTWVFKQTCNSSVYTAFALRVWLLALGRYFCPSISQFISAWTDLHFGTKRECLCVSSARMLHVKVTVGRFLIYMYDVPSRVLCLLSSMWSSVIWSVGPQRIDWLRRGRAQADDTLVTLL